MSAKKRGLGMNTLDVLLGGSAAANKSSEKLQVQVKSAAVVEQAAVDGDLRNLPVDIIQRGKYQPRSHMAQEALEELAESIRVQGVVQPIVVRSIGANQYEIIAGERRWRAAQMAELQSIPAVVRDVTDQAAIAMALIENIQRENLSPLEEANALARLIKEFDLTHLQAGEAVGRSRASVSNLLRLLELDDVIKAYIDQGELEMGHGRALLALAPKQQVKAARMVVEKGMSVRETERLVRKLINEAEAPTKAVPSLDPDIRLLQDNLSEKLGAKVQLQHGKGKGKLVINYNSLDELDGILAHIQ